MQWDDLAIVLRLSVHDLFSNGARRLLAINAHQQAYCAEWKGHIETRLLSHLMNFGWGNGLPVTGQISVNVEYNRDAGNPKRVEDELSTLKVFGPDEGKLFRPDIIVHQPGDYAHDLLAVEVTDSRRIDARSQIRDTRKLLALALYRYKYAYVMKVQFVTGIDFPRSTTEDDKRRAYQTFVPDIGYARMLERSQLESREVRHLKETCNKLYSLQKKAIDSNRVEVREPLLAELDEIESKELGFIDVRPELLGTACAV